LDIILCAIARFNLLAKPLHAPISRFDPHAH
jgi:hypothetical protein